MSLADLAKISGPNFYWSRLPGNFVNKVTGKSVRSRTTLTTGPQFHGTPSEWYETLVETIIDVSNTMHRNTLHMPNALVCSEEIATILLSSVMFKPSAETFKELGSGMYENMDEMEFVLIGTLSNRFELYVDKNTEKDKILVYNADRASNNEIGLVTVKNIDII